MKYEIPNVRNACRVLDVLTNEKTGLSIAELTHRLKIPRTSVLRIVSTLESEGVLESDGKRYSLGNALIRFGVRALENCDARVAAQSFLRQLSLDTRETAHLAILANDKSLIVEVCDSPCPVRVASRPGTLVDLHCSSTGKVFLAHLLSDSLDTFYKDRSISSYTSNTNDTIEKIRLDIGRTLAQGYGYDNEEFSEGIRCLASPVYNAFGHVVAAIGITASSLTFTPEKIEEISMRVLSAAAQTSARMGYEE